MASLISGYNYDIFISYRQKDNKHDGWVTEFVNNLKGELESTFKEEICVYFDINPHDGLLETHDVDESLKGKLKCLVFIPIISRTYCDPKSFAWEHEFKAFVEQASKDQFGLKVKLPNGNVASRVLPIRIHELDNEDVKLCESVIEGVLRGIDFIYKSPGVNRPLLPKENNPQENLNHTDYRDQINKVANAIKEISTALKRPSQHPEEITQEVSKPVTTPQKSKKKPIIITSVAALALIILGILFIPNLFKPSEELEKSIAVLPFRNDSPDQEMYFINGVMEEILDNLCKIEDIRVVSRSSVEQYRDNPKPIPVVAEEMDVSYVLEGSGQRDGDNIRLTVQLLDGKKDQHIWSESYYREIQNIFELQSEIAQAIAGELEAIITTDEQELIEKIPTTNLAALDFYQRGMEEYKNGNIKRAEILFNEALDNDSSFAGAYLGLAYVHYENRNLSNYYSENYLDSVLILVNKALSLDNELSEAYSLRGRYYGVFGKNDLALADIEKAINLNPNNGVAYYTQALLYGASDFVRSLDNFHKAISINRGQDLNSYLKELAWEYFQAGFVDKSTHYFKAALKLDGDSADYYWSLGYCNMFQGNFNIAIDFLQRSVALGFRYAYGSLGFSLLSEGRYKEALESYEYWIEYLKESNDLSFNNAQRIAYAYYVNGFKKEAEEYFDLLIEYSLGDINSNRRLVYKIFGYYDLAGVYAFRGEKEKAYENLSLFNQIKEVPYWMPILIKNDELFESIRGEPEFQQIARDVETKYQATHERVRKWLEEQGML